MKTLFGNYLKILLFSALIVFQSNFCIINASDRYSKKEKELVEMGLIDIQTKSSSIAVHLVYATPFNFMGRQLYTDLTHAFLLPKTAEMLLDAEKRLKKIRPDLSFLIYDAARPISIQKDMWAKIDGTGLEDFVADPTNGPGMHNIGVAVDLTLMDCTGNPLPMGSEYDYFGDEARANIESDLLAKGRITQRELENRQLLRKVMTEAGFLVYEGEWWHFNSMSPKEARESLPAIP